MYLPINDDIVVMILSCSSDSNTSKLVGEGGGVVLMVVCISISDGVVCEIVEFPVTICGTTIGVASRTPAKNISIC